MKPKDRNSLEDLLRVLPLVREVCGGNVHADVQEMFDYWLAGDVRAPWGACAVVERDGLVLAVMGKKGLGLPGGKGSPDESPQICALRELREETGLVAVQYHMLPASEAKGVLTYSLFVESFDGALRDSPEGVPCWVPPSLLVKSTFARFPEFNRWALKTAKIWEENHV